MAKVLADMGHNLWIGHFVGRFHREDLRGAFLFLKSLFQLALGVAGTKDQNHSGVSKIGNDLVVVTINVPSVFSLPRIVGWN
jgi:hypothetical protein